ncbi:delayed-rectifier potassium channel regulatory subunit KCNS3-like [Salvelinus sp. IW2-2015]|uniref:delayed-rectifier potassium channel regulatory subunit KCNS3-like n=1 Tax=Salvelinus sp. IW2-2015 TaxID=2691554 RepID=UPI000CEB1CAA|nr:potassium voltage-gated channel subfamily S member 3-like [Salvelinus alpinus]
MQYGQILHRRGPDDSFLNLNVGGFKQRVERSILQRFPRTRLGRLLCCVSEEAILELCDDFSPTDREYYFDRNPCFFRNVLNFYHTGKIHLMEELCVFSFSQEIEYWGIKALHLDSCCSNKFQEQRQFAEDKDWDRRSGEQQQQFGSIDSSMEELSTMDKDLEKFEGTWCSEVRKNIWLHLENPGYSCLAKGIAVASLAVVLTSIVAMCVHSMPEFHQVDLNDKEIEDPVLAIFEAVCVICFSVEFLVRLAVAPCARKFMSDALNIIDFVSIVPFYATLAFETVDEENEELENVGKVVQILRLMRIFRILKLARHSVGLRSLGATLRHSYHEVGLLILFLSVGISIFSALIYFVEKESEESDITTIPVGWWWATISMTTVGYGDTCPVTVVGKLVATICIVCGILVVALPITIIFNKFSMYYQRQKAMDANQSNNETDQCNNNNDIKIPDPSLTYFNVGDQYTLKMNSFITNISVRSSVGSEEDTDASSIQGGETTCILRDT